LSEINLALYRMVAQPMVRAMVSEPVAECLRRLHPLRLQYELLSDKNPWMAPITALAQAVRENRQPATTDNPFLALQETVSEQIVAGLNAWRDGTETLAERTFLTIYGNQQLQVAVGIDPADTRPQRKAAKMPLHRQLVEARIAELTSRIAAGGVYEGAIRALLYVGLPRAGVDARGFEAIRRLRAIRDETQRPPLAEFKRMVHDQAFILLLDLEAAVAALPVLIPDAKSRSNTVAVVRRVLSAAGEITGEVAERLQRIARVLGVEDVESASVAA
jgi:hypothetical protein